MKDRGEWKVESHKERVWIISSDFTHDVILRLDGDFADFDQKWAYMENIAERLNRTNKEDTD
jgi:hypothetical protein